MRVSIDFAEGAIHIGLFSLSPWERVGVRGEAGASPLIRTQAFFSVASAEETIERGNHLCARPSPPPSPRGRGGRKEDAASLLLARLHLLSAALRGANARAANQSSRSQSRESAHRHALRKSAATGSASQTRDEGRSENPTRRHAGRHVRSRIVYGPKGIACFNL